METLTQTDSVIRQKTLELCETMLKQPEFQAVRRSMDLFQADTKAQELYQKLSEKGQYLQHKQQQGLQLEEAEIAAFDKERDAFFNNPVAKGFVDAQKTMHEMTEEVSQYVSKTFELGRIPKDEDFESGSCGHGCGCH